MNPVDFHTASYQYLPHTPSESRRPGGHANIRVREVHPDVAAHRLEVGLGTEEEVARIDHGRRRSRSRQVVEELDLLGEAEVVCGDVGPRADV